MFKVTIPIEDKLFFGEEQSLDFLYLDRKAVLHVIDTAFCFSAATLLDSKGKSNGQSVHGFSLVFLTIWCQTYIAHPNRLHVH